MGGGGRLPQSLWYELWHNEQGSLCLLWTRMILSSEVPRTPWSGLPGPASLQAPPLFQMQSDLEPMFSAWQTQQAGPRGQLEETQPGLQVAATARPAGRWRGLGQRAAVQAEMGAVLGQQTGRVVTGGQEAVWKV